MEKNQAVRSGGSKVRPDFRVLITAWDSDVSPRFDRTLEVVIVGMDESGRILEQKNLILAEPSAEEICRIVLAEGLDAVVCGGIEEEHYQFLVWKKIKVIDGVIGSLEAALDRLSRQALLPNAIL
jgi:predicted Fe-Mo cluster-binding NifX family protein